MDRLTKPVEHLECPLPCELQGLVHRLPGVAYRCSNDARRTMQFISAGCRELTGYQPHDFLSERVSFAEDLIDPEDRGVVWQGVQTRLAIERPYELNYRIRHSSGEIRWVWEQGYGVLDESGDLVALEGFITDISGHEQLGRSRQLLAAIVEHCEEAICAIGLDGRIQSWNQAAEQISGIQASEASGKYFAELAPLDNRWDAEQLVSRSTQGESIQRVQTVLRRKDGSPIDVSVSISPLRDAGGTLVGASAIISDITARKKAEKSLRESQQQLRQIIDLVPHAIFAKDAAGTMLMANRATAELVGASVGEVVGRRQSDFHQPRAELEAMLSDDREVMASRRSKFIPEERFTDAEGRVRILQVLKIPFSESGSDRPAVLGVATDVTELKDAQAKLIRAERLAALGQFLAAIAHESRSALQRIQAGVDMLRPELAGNEEALEDLSSIERAGDTLQQLFNDLRSFAGPLRLQRCATDLCRMWRRPWDDLAHLRDGRRAQVLEAETIPGLTVCVDPFRMQQVFRNLMENSLAACHDPVRISIAAAETTIDDSPGVRIVFSDNGPGIDVKEQDVVFEPFFTTRPEGTGLGMAIAKRIVTAHGGRIGLIGSLEGGATFEIVIPRNLQCPSTSESP